MYTNICIIGYSVCRCTLYSITVSCNEYDNAVIVPSTNAQCTHHGNYSRRIMRKCWLCFVHSAAEKVILAHFPVGRREIEMWVLRESGCTSAFVPFVVLLLFFLCEWRQITEGALKWKEFQPSNTRYHEVASYKNKL